MSSAVDPIAPWPVVALIAAVVVALTLLAYRRKLRGTSGNWRWIALGLRLAALALCVLAALRPSLLVLQPIKQVASILFLTDTSGSMGLGGEAGGQTRLAAARRTLDGAIEATNALGPDVSAKTFAFDGELRETKPDENLTAKGRVTALGTALDEAARRFAASRVLRMIILSDGASNSGPDPLTVAENLRASQIPVVTVGFGAETTGKDNRDIAVRDLEAGPIVYARTQLEVAAKLDVRGYAGETIKIALRVEGEAEPVVQTQQRIPPGVTELNLRGLKWTPEKPGETKLELSVAPMRGELLDENNSSSTYVTVLKGGISVLYLQGPSSPWEKRFLVRALDASEKIQVQYVGLYDPANAAQVDPELQPGKYDVYILGDLPGAFLGRERIRRLADAVRDGAGLMMLGGRSSFGSGGWAGTALADVLPVEMHPGDGQLEPEAGLKVIPNPLGLDSYVLRLLPDAAQTRALWESLPPIGGTNRFESKAVGRVWAETTGGEPLIVAADVGRGRTLAFGGETWPWARSFDERHRLAHLNFWRNTVLWLAHKEDEGENQVRLELARRRVALGQKLDLTATARDAQGRPIPDAEFRTTVTRNATGAKPEPITLFRQGEAHNGAYPAAGEPGEYRIEVTASRGGQSLGTANARFLVYDDDREMRRTAADLATLRAVATASEGTYLAPEQLAEYLRKLKDEVTPEYTTQREYRLWDNWPFLLIFTSLLMLEWWLRKRHGWV